MTNKKDVIGYYKVEPKERIYFALRLSISLIVYLGLIIWAGLEMMSGNFSIFGGIISSILILILLFWLRNGMVIGLIKAKSVLIHEQQLPDIYRLVEKVSTGLSIHSVPKVYLLESGGLLNAFAMRFFSKNYVVIFAELLEDFYNGNEDAIEFVIAHELGHIKRGHLRKEWYLLPSDLIFPFTLAYRRACEYTCDTIGKSMNPKGAVKGILTLAGGKGLRTRLNAEAYMQQRDADRSFWRWFTEKLSTHPNLYKRLARVYEKNLAEKPMVFNEPRKPLQGDDHSRYMPT